MTKKDLAIPQDLFEVLKERLTPHRAEVMERAVARRTNQIRLVVQDIHQPHNVSACLRSAEAFGIQHIEIVTMTESFKASTVAKGVNHWLTIRRHHTVHECAKALKDEGFKLFTALPRPDASPLGKLPVTTPIAVVFGNEHAGVHADWDQYLDGAFTIPMAGVVESLNISVAAAVTMYDLTRRAQEECSDYFLGDSEQVDLLNTWVSRQIATWPEEYEHLKHGPREGHTPDLP